LSKSIHDILMGDDSDDEQLQSAPAGGGGRAGARTDEGSIDYARFDQYLTELQEQEGHSRPLSVLDGATPEGPARKRLRRSAEAEEGEGGVMLQRLKTQLARQLFLAVWEADQHLSAACRSLSQRPAQLRLRRLPGARSAGECARSAVCRSPTI
jgi:hypothetical protein